MNKSKDEKLEALFAQADQHVKNLRAIFDNLKGRKICSECGIDYDENAKHDCPAQNENNGNN